MSWFKCPLVCCRWGPSPRGAHLALAVLHEFACRPLHEVDMSDNGTLNIQLFVPQDLMGESYHSLIGGVNGRLSQIAKSSCISIKSHERSDLLSVLFKLNHTLKKQLRWLICCVILWHLLLLCLKPHSLRTRVQMCLDYWNLWCFVQSKWATGDFNISELSMHY